MSCPVCGSEELASELALKKRTERGPEWDSLCARCYREAKAEAQGTVPAQTRCSGCGIVWARRAEHLRRHMGMGARPADLCLQCWRARKAKAVMGAPVPEAELVWHLCPQCGERWAMSDGREVERTSGGEDFCTRCWKVWQNYGALWGIRREAVA